MAVGDIDFSNPDTSPQRPIYQTPGIPGYIPPHVAPVGFGQTPPPAGSGGFTPPPVTDYASILAADPFFNQLQKDLMAQSVADSASRDAARKRALIQFGEVPPGVDFGVSPDILELIRQNTDAGLSTTARLAQADVEARRGIRNALNARGTYNSGETGYQMGREATDYRRAQYDARNSLLDALSGYDRQLLEAERVRQMQLSDAALAAFLRGDYGGSGSPVDGDFSGMPVPGWSGDPAGGFQQAPSPPVKIDLSNDVKPLPTWYRAVKPVYGGFNVKAL